MANLQNNRISAELDQATIDGIRASLDSIEAALPFLLGLTISERRFLPKISQSNKLFVADALQAAQDNSHFLPAYIDIAEMAKDFRLYNQLDELILRFNQILEKMSDTQMLAGSESYKTALAFYQMIQFAAQAGLPGADTLNDMLKTRFEGQGNFNPPPVEDTGSEEDTPTT